MKRSPSTAGDGSQYGLFIFCLVSKKVNYVPSADLYVDVDTALEDCSDPNQVAKQPAKNCGRVATVACLGLGIIRLGCMSERHDDPTPSTRSAIFDSLADQLRQLRYRLQSFSWCQQIRCGCKGCNPKQFFCIMAVFHVIFHTRDSPRIRE